EQLAGPVDHVLLPELTVHYAAVVDARRGEGPLRAAGVLLGDVTILEVAKLQHRRLEELVDLEAQVGRAPVVVHGRRPIRRLPRELPELVPVAVHVLVSLDEGELGWMGRARSLRVDRGLSVLVRQHTEQQRRRADERLREFHRQACLRAVPVPVPWRPRDSEGLAGERSLFPWTADRRQARPTLL